MYGLMLVYRSVRPYSYVEVQSDANYNALNLSYLQKHTRAAAVFTPV